MNLLSKRIIYALFTLAYEGVLVLLYVLNFYRHGFYLVILAFFVLFALCYQFILRPYGKLREIYPKVLYWFLLSWTLIITLYFFPSLNNLAKFSFLGMSAILLYINLLSLNIYFVSENKNQEIPLLQSARLVISISVIIAAFLGSTGIYKFNYFFINPVVLSIVQVISFYLFFAALIFSSKWLYFNEKIEIGKEEKLKFQLASLRRVTIVVLSQFAVVLMFFPFEDFGRGLILGTLVYIALNLFQAFISRNINRRLLFESAFVAAFVYLLVYFT